LEIVIKVLIVEDSITSRELLTHILSSDPDIHVVGAAKNGEEACEFVTRQKPDVITMDIMMPGMDGYEATRRIMETVPVPIIIISAHLNIHEMSSSFRALEAGAVAVLEKPVGFIHPDYEDLAGKIVRKVKLMSEVRMIKRWNSNRNGNGVPEKREEPRIASSPPETVELVALGGSTGAPAVLKTILSRLPKDFPAPLVVVQHISPGFVEGLALWLDQVSEISISVATQGERLLPGRVYLAPDAFQMGVKGSGTIVLRDDPLEHRLRPSVSYLFRSVAAEYGQKAAGVLLTGMGVDGSAELKILNETGAVTIAQDRESSVVHGMPGEAIMLGGVTQILKPREIAPALVELVNRGRIK
jgi:two-component system, chemotaxis family, protein-glutamate methylesterase/glutaminase